MNDDRQTKVLDFWFRELSPQDWFGAGERLDAPIKQRFQALHAQAAGGALDHWAGTPLGRLALILILDQFSRHIHRGSPEAFATDEKAARLVVDGIEQGMDKQLALSQQQFFYMPLMHAEDARMQALCLEKFTAIRDQVDAAIQYARDHKVVIDDFGRFPHRNEMLGRTSTEAELGYLKETTDNW